MDETLVLMLLAGVMLVGSYLAGSIPLNVTMSEDKLKKVTVLGAGLLVGTALAVVIPEGVSALLPDPHAATPKSLTSSHDHENPSAAVHHHDHDHEHEESNLHTIIGIALVVGFVFMLLVDQISSNMNDVLGEKNITAMIGLVVHAAADGIALGAAATTSHADVEIIVFLAIMLHKAPAAFGLVTFLMHKGIERYRIRKYLLIFSCAAPLLTILTYFGIGQEGKETLSSVNATGIVMLFSAGTFLYVATVHVLPELMQDNHNWHSLPTSEGQPPIVHGKASLKGSEFVMLVIGALLPLLLSAGHHH